MGSDLVVVDEPGSSGLACLVECEEAMQVEELVASSTVERLDVRVLNWLARVDEVYD